MHWKKAIKSFVLNVDRAYFFAKVLQSIDHELGQNVTIELVLNLLCLTFP